MGEILSHSEVEAILSALDLSPPPSSAAAVPQGPNPNLPAPAPPILEDHLLYDFEHPAPLRPAQLGSLRLAAAAMTQAMQTGLSGVLHASVGVQFLGVEQSTYRDYLATSERPACLVVFESTTSAGTWLLDLSRSLAFTVVSCMLGGPPTASNPVSKLNRPFTEVEIRLIEKAVQAILPDLTGSLSSQNSLRMTRLISDGSLVIEAESNEAVALVSFEVTCEPVSGLMQLCIPWQQISQAYTVPVEAGKMREMMRSGANKIPVGATARIARMKLTARELASLNPGDVLLTDASPSTDVSLEVDGREIFRGTAGQRHERKVICLTEPATSIRIKDGSERDQP